MDKADIPFLSAAELSRLIEGKEVSPVEAVEAYLERTDSLDFKFNSYLALCSEFRAAFESACRDLGIRLFVLPPRSPKLNGHVERPQRTHTEEFYELYEGELEMAPLNCALQKWERLYDTYRPHQSLDGRTPAEYIEQCNPEVVSSPSSHMH